ncbi:hypothetical protein ACOSP7_007661 [Xanthoceras sorbifolium]
MLPDSGNDADDLLVGDLFGGVDTGDGVDNVSSREKVKDEEEGEIRDFEEAKEGLLSGYSIKEIVKFGGVDLGVV